MQRSPLKFRTQFAVARARMHACRFFAAISISRWPRWYPDLIIQMVCLEQKGRYARLTNNINYIIEVDILPVAHRFKVL